jgi:hypothetical protein
MSRLRSPVQVNQRASLTTDIENEESAELKRRNLMITFFAIGSASAIFVGFLIVKFLEWRKHIHSGLGIGNRRASLVSDNGHR